MKQEAENVQALVNMCSITDPPSAKNHWLQRHSILSGWESELQTPVVITETFHVGPYRDAPERS